MDKTKHLPRIVFPNKPLENERLAVGKGYNVPVVTSGGVVNHKDFPNVTAPFDVMLFHELCHAYYFQIGMAPEYFAINGEWKPSFDLSNTVEEMLVTGLEYGRGVEYCENNYRVQKGLALRKTYKAVGLEDANVTEGDWKQGKYVDPSYVIAKAKPTGLVDPRGQNVEFWKNHKDK